MMKTLKTGILASGFWRLKSPRWHSGALWASDLRAGKVFRIDPGGKATIVADGPNRPFGLGFLPDGHLLVASMTQRQILKFGAEKPTVHADMAALASGYLRDLVGNSRSAAQICSAALAFAHNSRRRPQVLN
jgi:sugar lactone lactonase YvrE